jgi:DNA processing protein
MRTYVRSDGEDLRLRLLALCAVGGANWHVIAREAQQPGGLEALLRGELTEKSKEARETEKRLKETLGDFAVPLRRASEELDRAASEVGALLVTVLDEDYPANLRVIHNLPPFLFYRGGLDRADARSVAVVGTRNASDEGLASARGMARLLAREKVTVLSGLALGIDTAAHEETLAQGGRTIAVVGTGILGCYPKENAELAEGIVERGAFAVLADAGTHEIHLSTKERGHLGYESRNGRNRGDQYFGSEDAGSFGS